MKDLIEKLEAATEGSRELDAEIAYAVQWRPDEWPPSAQSFREHEAKHDYATAWIAHAPFRAAWPIPHYTTSLDAALSLVPEGRRIYSLQDQRHFQRNQGWFCGIDEICGLGCVFTKEAATPALALAIAALKARVEMEG